jgi:hypothetical protein
MSDPVDLWQATCDAFFAALNAAIDPSMAAVRQELDENQQPPIVLVGDMDGSPRGGKFEIADLLTIDVATVYRGSQGKRGLLAIMWANRLALQNQTLSADGAQFSSVAWRGGDTARLPDGVTFVGLQQFEVFVEPA